jgi:hypothetical protein
VPLANAPVRSGFQLMLMSADGLPASPSVYVSSQRAAGRMSTGGAPGPSK